MGAPWRMRLLVLLALLGLALIPVASRKLRQAGPDIIRGSGPVSVITSEKICLGPGGDESACYLLGPESKIAPSVRVGTPVEVRMEDGVVAEVTLFRN